MADMRAAVYIIGGDCTQIPCDSQKLEGSAWLKYPRNPPWKVGIHRVQRFFNGSWLLLTWAWQCWELEVAHREVKFLLGLGDKQCHPPLAGDSARRDKDGDIWIIGRIDDVIKVSGYRLGKAEVESGLVSHPAVAEAAAIGLPHELRGNIIYAYCILRNGFEPSPQLEETLKDHIRHEIGPIAVPSKIEFVTALPKTRSGKIMRRVLKARATGQPEGDISTLEE